MLRFRLLQLFNFRSIGRNKMTLEPPCGFPCLVPLVFDFYISSSSVFLRCLRINLRIHILREFFLLLPLFVALICNNSNWSHVRHDNCQRYMLIIALIEIIFWASEKRNFFFFFSCPRFYVFSKIYFVFNCSSRCVNYKCVKFFTIFLKLRKHFRTLFSLLRFYLHASCISECLDLRSTDRNFAVLFAVQRR